MKRKILNLVLVLPTMALLLSSCLGDNDTTYETSNDFVYITATDSYQNYAVSSEYKGLGFTSPDMSKYKTDKCYFASYKLSTSDMATGGQLFNAQNLVMSEVIPQSNKVLFIAPPTSGTVIDSQVPLNRFSVQNYYPAGLLGDKWLLSINLDRNDGEEVSASIYYNKDNQFTDADKTPLATNKIVLDVIFTKTNLASKAVEGDYFFVLDLDLIRNTTPMLINDKKESIITYTETSGVKYAYVQVIFRYKKKGTDGNITDYYPSTTGSSNYVLYLAQEN